MEVSHRVFFILVAFHRGGFSTETLARGLLTCYHNHHLCPLYTPHFCVKVDAKATTTLINRLIGSGLKLFRSREPHWKQFEEQ